MAQQGKFIERGPNGVLEIKGRRRFQDPSAYDGFIDELQSTFKTIKESKPDAPLIIADCDLSQNPLSADQFEMLFMALSAVDGGPVRVQRFRLFGCCALNDDVMAHLSNFFRTDLTTETAPTELHLSDCAITTEGFNTFMSAIEETELFPTTHPQSGKKVPLYVRLENNYIDEAAIQEKVDAGIIRPFLKTMGGRDANGAKVDLVVKQVNGGFQQKTGVPPAPEDAPPPKEVYDKWTMEQQQKGQQWQKGGQQSWPSAWQGQSWQKGAGKGSWSPQQGKGKGSWSQPQQSWPQQGKGSWAQQATIRPVSWSPGPRPAGSIPQVRAVAPRPGVATVRPAMSSQAANRWQAPQAQTVRPGAVTVRPPVRPGMTMKGSAGSSADRSRTPAPRAPQEPAKKALPLPWEEHWSDEYKIPYFWNAETGEALWEKPAHW